jgi:Na+-transporting NADH:ubiquinone oxidoreductase subunit NqrF
MSKTKGERSHEQAQKANNVNTHNNMLHYELLKKAGGTIDVRHNNNGDATWTFIKRRKAKIYPSLEQLIAGVYIGINTEHFVVNEEDLDYLYASTYYTYQQLKMYHENKPDPNQLNLFES